jgi:glycosyltransferase involved in cell wall biosynthesis
MSLTPETSIAVLIPCYQEEETIAKVVSNFKTELPNADIFVYDNNSTDNTILNAKKAGAIIRNEPLQGKGNVIRRMFADIDADIYVLVDGDDTYDPQSATELINTLVNKRVDMVNGARVTTSKCAYRFGHKLGNKLLTNIVSKIFGDRISDMLSGYRAFSRRFVKSFPAMSEGFEIETELTIHALELRMPIDEIDTPYKERPEGSESKLRTLHDGIRILVTIIRLIKMERPLEFFFIIFSALAASSIVLSWPIFTEYIETGLVPRFPTAILSTGMMILAFLSLTAGFILDGITLSRRELKRLNYLSISPINDTSINR